jgi:hypothetical protein
MSGVSLADGFVRQNMDTDLNKRHLEKSKADHIYGSELPYVPSVILKVLRRA